MGTYAIGDVQGCYDALQQLLEKIQFEPQHDELWFVGDLVNRGDKSLEVLRFIKQLPRVKVVLGNHDVHLLALAHGKRHQGHHTLDAILHAPDRYDLLEWLQYLPLLHYDPKLNCVMVHAGIYPQWDLIEAETHAREVSTALQSYDLTEFIKHIYGNEPDQWHPNLAGWDRLRFIMNAFTRMRFCSPEGKLEFVSLEGADKNPAGYVPWFALPRRTPAKLKIIFGHWAALEGVTNTPNMFALDTGCIWGNCLTAMRLEDQQRFSVNCYQQ